VFIDYFFVIEDVINEEFLYQCIPAWDHVGHIGLITSLEHAFEIMMDHYDIVDFAPYKV
jgi:hypothetical protein